MFNQWLSIGMGICIACAVTSCAHYKYDKTEGASQEPATIDGDHMLPSVAQIMDVDGKSVGFGTSVIGTSVKLAPGEHSVRVLTFHGWTQMAPMSGFNKTLHFEAEAGHNYDIRCERTSNGMRVWIEDKTTGTVVNTQSRGYTDPVWQLKKDVGAYCPNADNGQVDAQLHIGNIYYEGRGIPQNLIQAYVWYSLSARGGNSRAADQLVQVTAELSPDQMTEAQQRLDEWAPGQCQSDLVKVLPEMDN